MVTKHVRLLPEWRARCQQYGESIVDGYVSGRSPKSLSVSSHDAQWDANLQARSKCAEVAFCFAVGIDPNTNLQWHARHPDPNYDVIWNRLRWDIKSTCNKYARNLIWPLHKNHIFESKKFDTLAFIKCEPPDYFMAGWTTKLFFAQNKMIADARHYLTTGTWYLDERKLWGFE